MPKQSRSLSIILTFFSLFLILLCTLFPFNFTFKETFFNLDQSFFILGWGASDSFDIIFNILLFIPLGIGVTSYFMQKKRFGTVAALSVVFTSSFGLSYLIEILQVFQPARFSSAFDLVSNCAGGLIGYLLFRSILLGYIALVFLLSIPLQMQTNLSNWDKSYPLLLGNEMTGDRPWKGYISELSIADRALSKKEIAHFFSEKVLSDHMGDSLLASYHLSGSGSHYDKRGVLPDLVWMPSTQAVQQGKAVFLDSHHWLISSLPIESLTQKIMKTSQFTLIVTVATDNTVQTGPARIVSLSRDPSRRNFTLGQQNSDLIFRLRTPLTGKNGTPPELILHDLFASKDPRHLIISYNGSVLQIYVDRIGNSQILEFSPGAAALSLVFPKDASFLRGYKIAWYAVIFIPLGFLIVRNVNLWKRHVVLISLCILLPSFGLEGILVFVSGRNILFENILWGMLFTACPIPTYTILIYSFYPSQKRRNF
jgi:glycopeptide antibiotics resistance protein